LAGEIYGLKPLRADMADSADNTTRFILLSATPDDANLEDGPCITTVVFQARSVPAALYKCLGGFATNGVNLTKLEGYITEPSFQHAKFYLDIEGHPDQQPVKLALDELAFFSKELQILGVYLAAPFRTQT
jgi:prephenate dehydratase